MCNPVHDKKTEISCPSCEETMVLCKTDPNSGRVQVKHYPGLKNVSKTSTFDFSEEVTIAGVSFSRAARRMHSDGRLFLAECSGVCLACSNPFHVYRVVHSSGPLPPHNSAVDLQHGYLKAQIFDTGHESMANSHLLEDVVHHGNYYGFWLESWSKAVAWSSLDEKEVAGLIETALDAAKAISGIYRESNKAFRANAGIV